MITDEIWNKVTDKNLWKKIPCSIQNWRDSIVKQVSGKNVDTALKNIYIWCKGRKKKQTYKYVIWGKKKLPMNGNKELYFSLTLNRINTHTKHKHTDDSRIIYWLQMFSNSKVYTILPEDLNLDFWEVSQN